MVLQLLLLLGTAAVAAPPNDVVLGALVGRQVTIENEDGTEVTGELLAFDGAAVVVVKGEGRVVSVERGSVAAVLLRDDRPDEPSPVDVPFRPAAVPLPPPPPSEPDEDVFAEVERLRTSAVSARRNGTLDLALWWPLSGLGLGLSVHNANVAVGTADASLYAVSIAAGVTSGICLVYFPISGAVDLGKAADLERRADGLESSIGVRLAPRVTADGGQLVLAGTF